MALFPDLQIDWLNGWLFLAGQVLIQGSLLLVFPKAVVARLFDRSGWTAPQKVYTILGKLFALACLVLFIFTPLQFTPLTFWPGLALYLLGLVGLVISMLNFKDTPLDQPVRRGLYRFSRHPQIVSIFVAFCGICLLIGSWAAFIALLLSRFWQHFGILAEEQVCLQRYGEPYRAYLEQVPRYGLF